MPERNSQILTLPSEEIQAESISKKQKNKRKKNLGSRDLIKKRENCTRVPDETMNLMDTVCGLDTGYILLFLGVFKLFLVVPLLVLGVVLISVRIAEFNSFDISKATSSMIGFGKDTINLTTPYDEAIFKFNMLHPLHPHGGRFGNDSIAPLWTAIMLAASAATDFVAIWKRHGSTIVLYMLVSTVSFVASILCIEYDRLEIAEIAMLPKDNSTNLKFQLYLSCVVFASVGVVTGLVTIYVGTRMAALEQDRLYMEREGLEAILTKQKKTFPSTFGVFVRSLSCIQGTETPVSSELDMDSLTIYNNTLKLDIENGIDTLDN